MNQLIIPTMNKCLWLALFFFCFSCTNSEVRKEIKSDSLSLIGSTDWEIKEKELLRNRRVDSITDYKEELTRVPLSIDASSKIEISPLVKICKHVDSTDKYSSKYRNWNIDSVDIINILKQSHDIDMHEFMYLYSVLDCELRGSIMVNGNKYGIEVNAGAFMRVRNADTLYMLASDEKLENLFLTGRDYPERKSEEQN